LSILVGSLFAKIRKPSLFCESIKPTFATVQSNTNNYLKPQDFQQDEKANYLRWMMEYTGNITQGVSGKSLSLLYYCSYVKSY
jgi:hypothetical protein